MTYDTALLAAVCDIGSASFKYDMRRLLEILALPKAWYRRSLARRMFLGEEPTVPDDDSHSGNDCMLSPGSRVHVVLLRVSLFTSFQSNDDMYPCSRRPAAQMS